MKKKLRAAQLQKNQRVLGNIWHLAMYKTQKLLFTKVLNHLFCSAVVLVVELALSSFSSLASLTHESL